MVFGESRTDVIAAIVGYVQTRCVVYAALEKIAPASISVFREMRKPVERRACCPNVAFSRNQGMAPN